MLAESATAMPEHPRILESFKRNLLGIEIRCLELQLGHGDETSCRLNS